MSVNDRLETNPEAIRTRFETLLSLFNKEFLTGLDDKYAKSIFLSEELLHCAVNAYFDDICKYKNYAGSLYADKHKQAAFTMLWISRYKPIQLKPNSAVDTVLLTINESFAIISGLMFLDPSVTDCMSRNFYKHLVYTLMYRDLGGKGLATMLYLMETAAINKVKF